MRAPPESSIRKISATVACPAPSARGSLGGAWSKRRRLRFLLRVLGAERLAWRAVCHGLCWAADGKVALLIASSQARTTTSSVFDADTGLGASIPLFVLRKTLEGRIGVGFRARIFGAPAGDGGVDSGYACGGLVPMWERGVGLWMMRRIGCWAACQGG
jgi:hypothetical protein